MSSTTMREVLVHGGMDEAFDRSVAFARQLAESFGARPEVHQAIENEARERLARSIPLEDQDRLGVRLVIRTGPEESEVVGYTEEHPIDLAIVRVAPGDKHTELASALIERGRCAVLVLR